MRKVTLPALIILFVLQARPANNFVLTVDNIMRGPALVGYEPTAIRWSHDSSRILFQWKRNTDKEIAPMDTYTVNRDGSGLRKLTDEELKLLPPAAGETTKDRRLMVYSSAGDRIRFSVEANAPGYLYIVNQGSSGTWKPKFPSAEIEVALPLSAGSRCRSGRPYRRPPCIRSEARIPCVIIFLNA